jgi:signal transduction histidine kinase
MFLIRDLVAARTWLALIHHIAGVIVGLAASFAVVILLFFSVGLLPLMLLGFPVFGLTLRLVDWLARFERARFAFLTGQRIPAWPAGTRAGYRFWLVPRWKAYAQRGTWSEIGYALLRLPVSLACFALAMLAWSVGLVLVTLPFYDASLPAGGAVIDGHVLHAVPPVLAACVLAGVGFLLAAPQLTRGLAIADTALARVLLGPRADLAARVAELETSRDRVVDAAEAERRRIERDLHDGAQQRLVALAMELGRAKAKFSDDVDAAADLVDRAHVEAKAALTELRDLVRGVHPPVLTDRGLDAALSGLAARCTVPVEVYVDVPVRPRPAVEAVAYFVVAEALTNIAKHSRASSARVVVEGYGYPGTLNIMISDDGVGGADAHGSGLAGLADRVSGVDGRLTVESPSGGPTIIAAVLPCG